MSISKMDANGKLEELPISVDVTLMPGERLISEACGGGGYGDPLARDPEHVRIAAIEGRISSRRASEAYGVALIEEKGDLRIDMQATRERRRTRQDRLGA
jgi:N-methylhydantoinase B